MDVGLATLIFVGNVGHYAVAACDVLRKLTLEGWAIAAWLASTKRQGELCAVRESVPGLAGKCPIDRWGGRKGGLEAAVEAGSPGEGCRVLCWRAC